MSQPPSPSPRHAIVSLRIPRADWVQKTEPLVEAYAERHGLDVVNLRAERLDLSVLRWRRRFRNLHLEKFQIFDLLEKYDRILYLDADVIVHPEAPNVFDEVPSNTLGVVNEQLDEEAPKREQEWRWMQRRLGGLEGIPKRYFNAGMMVISQAHQPLFAYRDRHFAAGRWPDQNSLNYAAVRSETALQWMACEWNCMPLFPAFHNRASRRKAWFIHYAGERAKLAMKEDLSYFQATPQRVGRAYASC